MPQTLANKVAVTISKAVSDGYADKFTNVAWGSPDWEMIRNLERNVYQFSFAKSYEQLKATTAALYDGEGKIVPFSEFKDVATRIGNEYNITYLEPEYATAIGSAQMASRWIQFNSEKDTFPNATYRTVGDDNVRPSHALLNGVTMSLDDPDIDRIWPPKGWRCRCDMEQSTSGKPTDKSKIVFPDDTPAMFRTNLAKNGLVFPKGHPYFTHLPEDVRKAADGQNPFLYEKIHTGKKGGYLYDNPLHNHGSAWEEELKTAKILADAGEKLILFPELDNNTKWQQELRKMVLPKNVKEGKNPDGSVDGKTIDLKVTEANTKSAIDAHLRKGKSQADIICIRLTAKMAEKELQRAIKGRVNRSEIKEVWIIRDGATKPQKYTREEIMEWK